MSIAFSGSKTKDEEKALGENVQEARAVASVVASGGSAPSRTPSREALPMQAAKPCRPPGYEIPFLRASFSSVPNVLPLSTAGMPSSIQTGAGASLR